MRYLTSWSTRKHGLVLVLALPSCVLAMPAPTVALADMSLEELSGLQVTSASRRAEPLSDAATALFVITADDIRRSGATSLPEALRLAPNLNVAQINNNSYSVSARGFSGTSSNKLLVLIDGRSVYTPLFAGVFWDVQDVMLQDIERIEVISGPGGTLWGVNAVNGVINVITRASRDTQGGLLTGTYGNRGHQASARYGPHGHEFDATLRHVSVLRSPDIPSYFALDLRWGWQVRRDLALSLTGRNLMSAGHAEYASTSANTIATRSELGPGVSLQVTMWF